MVKCNQLTLLPFKGLTKTVVSHNYDVPTLLVRIYSHRHMLAPCWPREPRTINTIRFLTGWCKRLVINLAAVSFVHFCCSVEVADAKNGLFFLSSFLLFHSILLKNARFFEFFSLKTSAIDLILLTQCTMTSVRGRLPTLLRL